MSTVRAQGRAWALTPRLQRRSLEAGSLSMASPATLGPYVLEAPLGVGGLGEVWRARDERLGRAVAIKLMRLEAAEAGRLEQEARLLARLNHPGIAALYDVGRCDRGWFLVMELVAGPGLDELVAAHPRGLAEAEVRRLGAELAAALAAAHAQGILHRDLKPSNLRLDASGRLKVLDFGLACLLEPVAETQSGQVLRSAAAGTLAYMAPEQWRGGALDERTDLWAAGAVLYELATGRRAFPQRSIEALEHAIVRGQPVPPAQVRPELSPALEAIILRLLERTPARRFPSAAALGRALARPLQPRPRPQPAGRVQVLVGALANHTGEAAFEGTLPELVFAALEQAPGLAVFPRARLGEALERMGAPGRQVDVAVGLELCQREGLAALLTGALHRLGHSYVLLLELHDRTGQRLCGLRRRFARPEQLLGVLDRMVRQLRQHLGESAAVVERTLPLERVTTPSLEALRCFTLSRVQLLGGRSAPGSGTARAGAGARPRLRHGASRAGGGLLPSLRPRPGPRQRTPGGGPGRDAHDAARARTRRRTVRLLRGRPARSRAAVCRAGGASSRGSDSAGQSGRGARGAAPLCRRHRRHPACGGRAAALARSDEPGAAAAPQQRAGRGRGHRARSAGPSARRFAHAVPAGAGAAGGRTRGRGHRTHRAARAGRRRGRSAGAAVAG